MGHFKLEKCYDPAKEWSGARFYHHFGQDEINAAIALEISRNPKEPKSKVQRMVRTAAGKYKKAVRNAEKASDRAFNFLGSQASLGGWGIGELFRAEEDAKGRVESAEYDLPDSLRPRAPEHFIGESSGRSAHFDGIIISFY